MKAFTEKYKPLIAGFVNELLSSADAEQYAGIPSVMLPAWGKHYDDALIKIAIIGKQQAKMSVRMLFTLLNKFGYRTTYGTEYACGRGSYKAVSSAYNYYDTHAQRDVARAIAEAFTKPDGSYAYDY